MLCNGNDDMHSGREFCVEIWLENGVFQAKTSIKFTAPLRSAIILQPNMLLKTKFTGFFKI